MSEFKGPSISYEEGERYKKNYRKGRYRTVVIVVEGKVIAAPYDERGARYEEGEVLVGGQRAVQEGEVM